MAMLTTSSIAVNLRPLSPIRHSCFPTTTSTPSLHLRLNLKCLATKEHESPESLQSTRTNSETILRSFSPLPLLYTAALIPGDGAVKSAFEPFVEIVKSLNLPDWLVHWGHPANMAVVLFAMGGYGTYLGFRIRYSDDVEEKAKAKDLHPKLLAGIIGLALLTIQTILPSLFEGNPALRNVHGILGSSIMTLFLIHAAFGLQLGLSS